MSRTALLYYESIGLMRPPERSAGNYRRYGERDLKRLLEIRAYRDAGLSWRTFAPSWIAQPAMRQACCNGA